MPRVAGPVDHWRRADDLLTRRTTRSVLVLTPETQQPLVLGGTAMTVWDELAQPIDDDTLVERVAGRLGVGAEQVHDEVVSTRATLHRAGAVVAT